MKSHGIGKPKSSELGQKKDSKRFLKCHVEGDMTPKWARNQSQSQNVYALAWEYSKTK